MSRICTICARGGSKGVKSKNIRELAGKPLIAYSLEQAQASHLFELVAVSSDSAEVLDIALERLPADQRTAIVLREYQGLNSEEIAEVTGVPATTVRTRIFYGLKSVRKILKEMGIENQPNT